MNEPEPSEPRLKPILPPSSLPLPPQKTELEGKAKSKYDSRYRHLNRFLAIKLILLFVIVLGLLFDIFVTLRNPGTSGKSIIGVIALILAGYIVWASVGWPGWHRRKRELPASPYLLRNTGRITTFKDVAIAPEAMNRLKRSVEYLKDPQKYQKLGAQLDRGLLLVGPSGVGKTHAAVALAGEAILPVFLVPQAPASTRELVAIFDEGKKNSPSIIFIDNIESIARSPSFWPDPQTQTMESMLVCLLAFLDHSSRSDGVFILAATNRPELIDEALVRPGRMAVLEISYPDLPVVEQILKIHTRKIPLSEDVDIAELSRRFLEMCPQCSGAMINESVNQAASSSAERSQKLVDQKSLLMAFDEVRKRVDCS